MKAKDPLEKVLLNHELEAEIDAKDIASMLDSPNVSMLKKFVEPLDRGLGPPPKPSIKAVQKLKLKPLPSHLKYAFLGVNITLSIIISSFLSVERVKAALRVLKSQKRTMGWKMVNLYGIYLGLFIYIIFMEEGHKPLT